MNNNKDYPQTPTHSLALPEGEIFLKREDLNPTGSHKDRGVPDQIRYHLNQGAQGFVLSSSGNAAIAAAAFCEQEKIPLLLFLSPKTAAEKIKTMQQYPSVRLFFCEKPINFARAASTLLGYTNLRASLDPSALLGYRSLGEEISQTQPDAVFSYMSSGTSLIGLSLGLSPLVPLFPVQNFPQCHFAQQWDQDVFPESEALLFSLGVKNSPREDELSTLVNRSQGSGVVVGASFILETQKLLRAQQIETSLEGASTVAGWRKLRQLGHVWKRPLCILTGKAVSYEPLPFFSLPILNEYLELKEALYTVSFVMKGVCNTPLRNFRG